MVRCNRISDANQHPRILDGRTRLRLDLCVGEVRGKLDVRAAGIPVEAFGLLRVQLFPLLRSKVHRRVTSLELVGTHRVQDR